jgi:hypothetical protein
MTGLTDEQQPFTGSVLTGGMELPRFWRGPKRKSWVMEDTRKMMHTSLTYIYNTYFYFTIKRTLLSRKIVICFDHLFFVMSWAEIT